MGQTTSMFEQMSKYFESLPPFLWNLLLIVAAVVIGILIKFIFKALTGLISHDNEEFSLLRSILKNLSTPLTYFLPVFVFNMMLPFMKVSAPVLAVIDKITEIALIAFFTVLLISIINVISDFVVYKFRINKPDNLRERKIRTQLQFLRKLIVSIIILCAVCFVLLSFENLRKLGAGLLTGVGIGGIIIGFAAQKSLGNILAGFQIAFTQPLRIDDVLVVEGEWGRVEEITLTYVVLNIWDQRRLILPINYFVEKPFQNWTRTHSEMLSAVMMYLDYTVPVDALREEFNRLMKDHPLWDKRVAVLQVTNFTDKTVEVRLLISTTNSGNGFDLRCFLREAMLRYIKDNYPESFPRTRMQLTDNTIIPGR